MLSGPCSSTWMPRSWTTSSRSGAADDLDERAFRAEVALLVSVEDGHEGHLGKVDALAQEVHPDDHVVHPEPQVAKDLHPLDRLDLRVQVVHLHAHLAQVVGEVL